MTWYWDDMAEYLMIEMRLQSILTRWNNRLNLTWWKWTGINAPFCIWLLRGKLFTIIVAYGEKTWYFLLHVSSVWINSIIAKKLRRAQITFLSKKYRLLLPFYSEEIIAVCLLVPSSSNSFQFWGLEVQCRPHQTKVQVLAVCIVFVGLYGKIHFLFV